MPFGIHKISGHRYGFYYPDGSPLVSSVSKQIYALSALQTVPDESLESFMSYESSESQSVAYLRFSESTASLSERLKNSITVLEFVSQYVDLKPTPKGAIGHCPFHDDNKPSFGINEDGNYWNCFAGCGGGSIIDF